MNAGFSNFATLKENVLSSKTLTDTRFDNIILGIGLGMAGLIDDYCNRHFIYTENARCIITGDRPHYFLENFPIVSIAKVEMRYFLTDNWTDIDGQPISIKPDSGKLDFGYTLGRMPLQVRITYTGGYWFEQLEPTDQGYPSSAPAAIQALDPLDQPYYKLPDSVKQAWLLQCQEVWNKRDKLGLGTVQKPNVMNNLALLEFVPIVKSMLEHFKRYQLS